MAGQTITGKLLNTQSVLGSHPALMIFSFSRAGGRDAQLWMQHFMEDDPHLATYSVIFLESVPALFRALAVAGIKEGIPAALQDRTLLMDQDEDLWRQRLRVGDGRQACVMLLRPTGQIQWITLGPFTNAAYSEFTTSIRAMNRE